MITTISISDPNTSLQVRYVVKIPPIMGPIAAPIAAIPPQIPKAVILSLPL